jgi:hypothetical protein
MSTYPPAPWKLGGWGVATISLLDSAAAAAFVPDGAQLVTVAPGRTLGGLFFLSYECGPLVYRELNIVAGLVRVGLRLAFLLPRLYVDSAASLAGGREIWGLPKEIATFEIEHAGGAVSIDVRQGVSRVCRMSFTSRGPGVDLPVPLAAFGSRDDAFLFFTARLSARFRLARSIVDAPEGGELRALGLDRPRVAFACENLTLAVPAPRAVMRRIPILALSSIPAPAELSACRGTSAAAGPLR